MVLKTIFIKEILILKIKLKTFRKYSLENKRYVTKQGGLDYSKPHYIIFCVCENDTERKEIVAVQRRGGREEEGYRMEEEEKGRRAREERRKDR